MSITDKPYRVRNCSRHEDPDNSGQCIHCGGITYPDAEDWATQPEICIGDRPTTTNDEQGYYSKGIDPDGIIASAIKRKEAEDPRLQKGEQFFQIHTPAERAPMLSEEKIGPSGLTAKRIAELIKETGLKEEPLFTDREIVRRVVESLITKGVLRVVTKVTATSVNDHPLWKQGWECDGCGCAFEYLNNFCPGCGSEIVKP